MFSVFFYSMKFSFNMTLNSTLSSPSGHKVRYGSECVCGHVLQKPEYGINVYPVHRCRWDLLWKRDGKYQQLLFLFPSAFVSPRRREFCRKSQYIIYRLCFLSFFVFLVKWRSAGADHFPLFKIGSVHSGLESLRRLLSFPFKLMLLILIYHW